MGRPRLGVLFAIVCTLTACELTEVTIVDFAEIFIVEAKVTVAEDPAGNSLRVFIHGTAPGSGPGSRTFDDARVTVVDSAGNPAVLDLAAIEACVAILPEDQTGSCFTAGATLAAGYEPGESLTLDVELVDGRRLSGSTTIPGGFELGAAGGTCLLTPDTRLPLEWTPSQGAQAYVSETLIVGLPDALADEGIEAPDTLYLVGLSISESDTTVSFPDQFGVFDRFDLDRDLAVRLQAGLPEGASAQIAITALDENETNWARGGNFNPSGPVRVSSLVGDGSGAFGSAVTRRFTIVSSTDTLVAPACTQP